MPKSITDYLAQLDANNDEHWTADGLPRVDVVSKLASEELTRQQITDADPKFNREAAKEQNLPPVTDDDIEEIKELADLSDEELLAIPINELPADVDVLAAWTSASSRFVRGKREEMKKLEAGLKAASRQQELVDRMRIRLKRQKGNATQRNIQAFLKRQQEARAEKAKRARIFIEAGTTAEDVANQLSGKSPLDKAMSARKGAKGRPNYPTSVQQ